MAKKKAKPRPSPVEQLTNPMVMYLQAGVFLVIALIIGFIAYLITIGKIEKVEYGIAIILFTLLPALYQAAQMTWQANVKKAHQNEHRILVDQNRVLAKIADDRGIPISRSAGRGKEKGSKARSKKSLEAKDYKGKDLDDGLGH